MPKYIKNTVFRKKRVELWELYGDTQATNKITKCFGHANVTWTTPTLMTQNFLVVIKKMSDPEPDQVQKWSNTDPDPTKQKRFRFGSTKLMDSYKIIRLLLKCMIGTVIYYKPKKSKKFLYLNVPRGMKGSLMATTVAPLARAARNTRRPIRPNPLIPISAILSENVERDKGGFFWFDLEVFMYFIQHCFICRPSDSTV